MVAATLAAATRRLNYRCSYCLKKRGRRGGGGGGGRVSDTFNAPQVTLSCLVWSGLVLLYYIICNIFSLAPFHAFVGSVSLIVFVLFVVCSGCCIAPASRKLFIKPDIAIWLHHTPSHVMYIWWWPAPRRIRVHLHRTCFCFPLPCFSFVFLCKQHAQQMCLTVALASSVFCSISHDTVF